jgi:hypothetical protein
MIANLTFEIQFSNRAKHQPHIPLHQQVIVRQGWQMQATPRTDFSLLPYSAYLPL